MAKIAKRMKAIRSAVDCKKLYTPTEAFEVFKKLVADASTNVKFVQSVDVDINLGIDVRKSDQNVRGAIVLPNGTGRTVRVAVFTQGDNAEKAKAAGADLVGMDELAKEVKAGNLNFDTVIASPDAMRVVGQLGQILGPRGLMPNPKDGTVTPDIEAAVKKAKAGQVRYRNDKCGIVHTTLGKVDFEPVKLKENLEALVATIKKQKPASAKGTFIKKICVSTTMGPGLTLDLNTIEDKAGA